VVVLAAGVVGAGVFAVTTGVGDETGMAVLDGSAAEAGGIALVAVARGVPTEITMGPPLSQPAKASALTQRAAAISPVTRNLPP
jgi:hypothetical protein